MTVLRLIADDLTGALDSAAQFAGRIGPVPVLLRLDAPAPSGTAALDLACRDRPQAEAIARTRQTAAQLRDADLAFKKIDSLLRGHWAAELACLAALGLFRRILVAPAFPAQGRVTRRGRHYAQNAEARWDLVAVDPTRALAQYGVVATHDLGAAWDGETVVVICDAATDADLDAIVEASRGLPGPTLYCGSAGLAKALAGTPPPQIQPTPGPHLVISGSNHPVSLRQWSNVAARDPGVPVRFDGDAAASAARIAWALESRGRCIATADPPPGSTPAEAADFIASALGGLMPRLARPSMLTVIGGETFAAICAALGVDSLSVDGEWRPGVPASRMVGGRWPALPCLSKSGAFGAPGDLIDLLNA